MPKSPNARFTLVVEYEDDFPNEDDLQSLVEDARCSGRIVTAELKILREVTKDLR